MFRRNLIVILALLLLVPIVSWAGDWLRTEDTTDSCQKIRPGTCCQAMIESDLADIIVWTDGVELSVFFDMDEDGSTPGTTVDLYGCSNVNQTQVNCNPLEWDTDGDGIVDNNTMDGTTVMRRGVMGVFVPALLIDPTAHVQDALIVACGVGQ